MDGEQCHVCDGMALHRLRGSSYPNHPSWYCCRACRSECLLPQPSDSRLAEIYSPSYYEPWAWETPEVVQRAKGRTLGRALAIATPTPGQLLLDVGCAQGEFAALAVRRGLIVSGVDLNRDAVRQARIAVPTGTFHCGQIDTVEGKGQYNIITMFDFIEHVRNPLQTLERAEYLLADGGSLVLLTPRVGSLTHKLTGRLWPQYREEHLHLFSLAGLRRALERVGLAVEKVVPGTKYSTPNYLLGQLSTYAHPVLKSAANQLRPITKARPMHVMVPMRFGEVVVLARKP